MSKYISSETIKNEADRLSLINQTASPYTYFKLYEIKAIFPNIQKILDVGCGTGEAFPIFKEVFPNAAIVGIDSSKEALELAGKKKIAAKLITADINSMTYNFELGKIIPFDLIFTRNTLIHIKNPQFLLEEMIRCGKKESVIFAQEADWSKAYANWGDFKIFKTALIKMMENFGMNPYIGKELKNLFKKADLKNIKIQSFSDIIKPENETWDILFYLLDVAGEKIAPFLKEQLVHSTMEMRERLELAKKNSESIFQAPSWNIVFGEK